MPRYVIIIILIVDIVSEPSSSHSQSVTVREGWCGVSAKEWVMGEVS